jgi:hypothetical protein
MKPKFKVRIDDGSEGKSTYESVIQADYFRWDGEQGVVEFKWITPDGHESVMAVPMHRLLSIERLAPS